MFTLSSRAKPRDLLFAFRLYPCLPHNAACYNHFMGVIVKNPDVLGGTPVFRGTRVPIQTLFDYLEGGESLEDFLQGFPTVSREMAVAALQEAKHLLLARP
jgi:uncharacterized protein (DUF433 family)